MSRKKVISAAIKHGLLLQDCGQCLRVDPPTGYVLKSSGFHSTDVYYGPLDITKAQAWTELWRDVEAGIEPCGDADCDSCVHEPQTFEELADLYNGEVLVMGKLVEFTP